MDIQPKKYLTGISIGLRFGPSFSICDNFGTLADEILFEEGSFFDNKVFPIVNTSPFQLRLENQMTGDYLVLSQQDVIINFNFDDTVVKPNPDLNPKIKSNRLKDINASFEQLLVKLKDFEIERILRLGYINKYIFDSPALSKAVVDSIVGKSIDGASDMTLRFSKRYPVLESLAKKGINNYHKVIFTLVKRPDTDELAISVDYQIFYEPRLSSIKDLRISDFFSDMEHYNFDSFPKWLAKLGEK